MKDKQRFYLVGGMFLLAFLYIMTRTVSYHYLNYLWFDSQGQAAVWTRRLWLGLGLFCIFTLVGFGFYLINLIVVRLRLGKLHLSPGIRAYTYKLGIPMLLGIAMIGQGVMGASQGSHLYILATHAPQMGVVDPIFQQDFSFYMFRLEWMRFLLTVFRTMLFFGILITVLMYFLMPVATDLASINQRGQALLKLAIPHLAILLALFVLSVAFSSYFNRYDLVLDGSSNRVTGASYVDDHARAPALMIFVFISIAAAIVVAISGYYRSWKPPLYAAGACLLVYLAIVQIYPGLVQYFKVSPQEFASEKQYIEHSIKYTRMGYGLSEVKRRKFPARKRLTAADINKNKVIIDNIRLWDYRPIKDTFRQLQEIRRYYRFQDVDVDRYMVNGQMRQVILSAREMNKAGLKSGKSTWESRHLQYTHGYGLVKAPTNRVTPEGQPELWIKDFPPRTTKEGVLQVKQPGIYYGELTDDYVVVGTSLKEIDYPLEENFAETVYEGKGGVELGSGLHKFLVALQFDTYKLWMSNYVQKDSRILFNRQLHDAVRRLAPFLKYDSDPYLVISNDGRLYWMLDAYTVSDRFPYSQRLEGDLLSNIPRHRYTFNDFVGMNYVRNSVKVVINAYDGDIKFYVFDKKDPVIAGYRSFYDSLFVDVEQMPTSLRAHVRFPENLFLLQAAIYTDYHMNDPLAMYNLEDRWQIATEVYSSNPQQMEPYYTVIRLPEEDREEYILMLPFIPEKKQNMIAWLAARCDYDFGNYGELQLFDFPRTKQVYGPIQIESRIDQDPEISQDFKLWNSPGSQVIRGNLLVIPIEDSLLYVEPIYLKSKKSPFPELRRVIVADGTALVMGNDLQDALRGLTGGSRINLEQSSDGTTAESQSTAQLAQQARAAMQAAQRAYGRGDWAEYGRQMDILEDTLQQLK